MITDEAIQRRINCLEWQENDYFKEGMERAVAKAKANGFTIKPYDSTNYPYLSTTQASYLSSSHNIKTNSQQREAICGPSFSAELEPASEVSYGSRLGFGGLLTQSRSKVLQSATMSASARSRLHLTWRTESRKSREHMRA